MIFMSIALLIIFYILDSYYFKNEKIEESQSENSEKLSIEGSFNLLLLIGVIVGVLISGFWKPGYQIVIYHVGVEIQNLIRDILLLSLTYAS